VLDTLGQRGPAFSRDGVRQLRIGNMAGERGEQRVVIGIQKCRISSEMRTVAMDSVSGLRCRAARNTPKRWEPEMA